MLSALPGPTLQKDDDTLRVYDMEGNWLTIRSHQLNAMRFDTRVDIDNAAQLTVTRLTFETDDGDQTFEPVPLPRFSRSRVLLPIATLYWPDQDADHMIWGNARMTLAGSAFAANGTGIKPAAIVALVDPARGSERMADAMMQRAEGMR